MTQLLLPLSRPAPTPTGFWAELGEWMVGERDEPPVELTVDAPLVHVRPDVREVARRHRVSVNAQSGRRS